MADPDGQNNPHPAHDRDALRPGEVVGSVPAGTDAGLTFIGWIRTPWHARGMCPRQGDRKDGPLCTLHIAPEFQAALQGLEDFGRIEVLYWLHQARRDLLQQSPKSDGALRGTFALRSPLRPNPIGTSLVRLEGISNGVLSVRGLDCLDGTPLIDIKPDRCSYTPLAPPR